MKAFTKDEVLAINQVLDTMTIAIYKQEDDSTKCSAVAALIDTIRGSVYDAEHYDLPLWMAEGILYTLVMMYTGLNKYKSEITDIIWDAYFRNVKESV